MEQPAARRHVLQQALRQEHQRLLALQAISSRISAIFDLDQLLSELVQIAKTTLGYYNTLIFLLDEEQGEISLKASGRFLPPESRERHLKIEAGDDWSRILYGGEAVFIADVSDCEFCIPSSREVLGIIIAPMLVGGRPVGFFQAEGDRPDVFQKQDLQLMTSLAGQAGAAIEAARLLKKSRDNAASLGRWVRNLMVVNRIAVTLTSSLDTREILELSIQQLVKMSDVDYGCALMLEKEREALIIAEYPQRHYVDRRFLLPHSTSIQETLDAGTPCAVENARDYPLPEPLKKLRARSLLLIPLVARGKMIGLLILTTTDQARTFVEEEKEICQTVASQTAVAVANAQLLQDVQQQKQALLYKSQELSEESSKLDSVLNNIADGLVVTDLTGTIILSNPAFSEMIGLGSKSPCGCPLDRFEPVVALLPLAEQALQWPRRVFTESLEFPEDRIVKASATALRLPPSLLKQSKEEQVAGAIITLRDITHEVKVDRMKTDFISAVSHELRSPLTSILGFSSLIQRDLERRIIPAVKANEKSSEAAERVLHNLTIIENESMRLTRLVNDMLDIAKMEAGRMEWRMEKTKLAQVIDQAVATTSALAEERELDIQVHLPSGHSPVILGDRDRLIQVMTNLLSNAIKYTEQGKIDIYSWKLTVSGGAYASDGPLPSSYAAVPPSQDRHVDLNLADGVWAVVSVADTGVGIDAEDLPHVFEKFRQLGNAPTSQTEGTGLGLSICKEIVEHHKGRIWLESEQGKGSTFSFALPLQHDGE